VDVEITPTIFRVFEGEVIALFPTIIADEYGHCMSYQHVGQHGGANYLHVTENSRPAKPEEYEDLLRELVDIGYAPKVYRRKRGWMREEMLRQYIEYCAPKPGNV
jgi:hypothetical protein